MATSTSNLTRMDLTAIYGGVAVKCWSGHWQEGDYPDKEIFREGVTLDQAADALTAAGWVVTIFAQRSSNQTARAIRGEDTRIDFYKTRVGLTVKHYCYGWKAHTRPIKTEQLAAEDLPALLTDLRARGWTVREWPNGARAWRGQPQPVRNAHEITVFRYSVEKEFSQGEGTNIRNFNLAFDL